MSAFDDQVYNLKEALWHERGDRPKWHYPRAQDILEAERRKKLAALQAVLAPEPPMRFIEFAQIVAGGIVFICLVLALAL